MGRLDFEKKKKTYPAGILLPQKISCTFSEAKKASYKEKIIHENNTCIMRQQSKVKIHMVHP